jgi:hypothetical protein
MTSDIIVPVDTVVAFDILLVVNTVVSLRPCASPWKEDLFATLFSGSQKSGLAVGWMTAKNVPVRFVTFFHM